MCLSSVSGGALSTRRSTPENITPRQIWSSHCEGILTFTTMTGPMPLSAAIRLVKFIPDVGWYWHDPSNSILPERVQTRLAPLAGGRFTAFRTYERGRAGGRPDKAIRLPFTSHFLRRSGRSSALPYPPKKRVNDNRNKKIVKELNQRHRDWRVGNEPSNFA